MNNNLLGFIKNRFNNKVDILKCYYKMKYLKIFTLKDLLRISNILCVPYQDIIRLYLCGMSKYTYAYLINLIDKKRIKEIKELILNNGIFINNDYIYFNSYDGWIALDDYYYQEILKLLINNNEINIANLISSNNCYLKDISPSINNIEGYLFNEESKTVAPFLIKVYTSLDNSIKEHLEPKLLKVYLESIDKIKSKRIIDAINTPFISIKRNKEEIEYKVDELYKQFKEENISLINQKLCLGESNYGNKEKL